MQAIASTSSRSSRDLALRILGLAAGLALLATPGPARAAEHPMLGETAPGFRLESIDGETVDLAELRGRIVVLHFATGWCPFCNAEGPHLEQLWRDTRDRGVQVIAIDVQESPEATRAFAERWEFSFPTLLDPDGAVAASYAPEGVLPDLPREHVVIAANLVIDPEGRIRHYSLLDSAAFDARLTAVRTVVEELVEEAAAARPADQQAAAPAASGGCPFASAGRDRKASIEAARGNGGGSR